LALAALVVPTSANAAVQSPKVDPFYQSVPGFESTTPGTTLRTRSVKVTGLGIPIPGINATQTQFRSTDSIGRPITAVQTLLVPQSPWITLLFGKRPLIGYQTPIDGLGPDCNPSYLLQTGTEWNLALMVPLLLKGYAVSVIDYEGPRNAYGAGMVAGRATLDGLRSAQKVSGMGGSGTPIGLWGYSGGSIATGWAAELQSEYAPELNIKGSALGGTPADMIAIGKRMDGSFMSSIFLMGVVGVSREYPDSDSFRPMLNAKGEEVERKLANACIADGALMYPFRKFEEFTTVKDPLNDPRAIAFAERLKLGNKKPKAPIYLYHAVLDEGMPYEMALNLRKDWCTRGAKVQFAGRVLAEHISLAAFELPNVVDYLANAVSGNRLPSNC
jgi:hypothetical protein